MASALPPGGGGVPQTSARRLHALPWEERSGTISIGCALLFTQDRRDHLDLIQWRLICPAGQWGAFVSRDCCAFLHGLEVRLVVISHWNSCWLEACSLMCRCWHHSIGCYVNHVACTLLALYVTIALLVVLCQWEKHFTPATPSRMCAAGLTCLTQQLCMT